MGREWFDIVPVFNSRRDRQEYNILIIAGNGKTMGYGGQGYTSRRDARRAIAALRKVARNAYIRERNP